MTISVEETGHNYYTHTIELYRVLVDNISFVTQSLEITV